MNSFSMPLLSKIIYLFILQCNYIDNDFENHKFQIKPKTMTKNFETYYIY